MELSQKPDGRLAKKALPAPLQKALFHLFAQNISGCMLVGGTALSGFYAGHRRSDDLDLFVRDETAFTGTLLAMRALQALGTQINEVARSNQYAKAVCSLDGHSFTVDIVLDKHLFQEGGYHEINNVAVADLQTLFMMKSAALLSRCSEKDLYDLEWMFSNLKALTVPDILLRGSKIDTGMRPETLLYSIASSQIRKEACDFSLDPALNVKTVYGRVEKFKKRLVRELTAFIRSKTTSELKPVIDALKDLRKTPNPRHSH